MWETELAPTGSVSEGYQYNGGRVTNTMEERYSI